MNKGYLNQISEEAKCFVDIKLAHPALEGSKSKEIFSSHIAAITYYVNRFFIFSVLAVVVIIVGGMSSLPLMGMLGILFSYVFQYWIYSYFYNFEEIKEEYWKKGVDTDKYILKD